MIEGPIDNVFLIDDSDIDLFVQRKFLEINKFADQIITYNSPLEALKDLNLHVKQGGTNLIFLDLNMPLIDGFEFLDRFNTTSGEAQNVRVVVLTSSSSNLDREKAKKYANVIDFISKPLNDSSLTLLRKKFEEN